MTDQALSFVPVGTLERQPPGQQPEGIGSETSAVTIGSASAIVPDTLLGSVWETAQQEKARRSGPSWMSQGAISECRFLFPLTRSITMSRPSMTALLGLLAVAGFQNRDKIAEMLRGTTGSSSPGSSSPGSSSPGSSGPGQQQSGLGGLLGNLGGAGVGGLLGSGLNELVERFKQNGQGDIAESWVGPGPNKEVAPPQLEQAIGPDVLATLSQQTGLSRDELLARLSRELPTAVDKYTPEGRLPTEQDVSYRSWRAQSRSGRK